MAKTHKDRRTLFDKSAHLIRRVEKAFRSDRRSRDDRIADRRLRRDAEVEYFNLKGGV